MKGSGSADESGVGGVLRDARGVPDGGEPPCRKGDRAGQVFDPNEHVSYGALTWYFRWLGQFPLITRERERALAIDGASPDLNALITANLSYVVRVATEYLGRGIPFEDLIGLGNIGLTEAAIRFRGARGTKFVTFADRWIRKPILKALGNSRRVFGPSRYTLRQMVELRDAEGAFRARYGRMPDRKELADKLGWQLGTVDFIQLLAARRVWSLDDRGDDGTYKPVSDIVPSARPSAQAMMITLEQSALVVSLLDELPEQERTVLRLRYGFDGPGKTLVEISSIYGLSKARISQIHAAGIRRLRSLIARTTDVKHVRFGSRRTTSA